MGKKKKSIYKSREKFCGLHGGPILTDRMICPYCGRDLVFRNVDSFGYPKPIKILIAALSLFLFTACSHISVSDARWISQNAKSIDQVHDLLGSPEELTWEGPTEVATYRDMGRHLIFLGYIPGVNVVLFPVILLDMAFDVHYRTLVVRYNHTTGEILSVDHQEGWKRALAGK